MERQLNLFQSAVQNNNPVDKDEVLETATRQQDVAEVTVKEVAEATKYTQSLGRMINRINTEPKVKMVYYGIKENSMGFFFGQGKSGKTICCENLAMSIAAGLDSYLGRPIDIQNRKVLFISLEEFYAGRTERNQKQAARLCKERGDEWLENYIVVNEDMPRYLASNEDWELVLSIIEAHMPGVVVIDSLSRLYEGSIEDSKVAKDVMKRLRELANKTRTAIIVIHHTPKLYNTPLTINTIAGSRVLAQDADFMIGLNKTVDGTRYIKDVAYRYVSDDFDAVRTFTIGEDLWLSITGEVEEAKLLAAYDGRKDDSNKERLYDFLVEKSEANESNVIVLSEISEKFVETDIMSRQTVFNQLNTLENEGRITKFGKGKYKVVVQK